MFRAFWTNTVVEQVEIRDFVVLMLQNAQKIEVSGSVTNTFRLKTYLKSCRQIFRAFWTDTVVCQVEICDFVVLMLQNAQKTGVSGSLTTRKNEKIIKTCNSPAIIMTSKLEYD
jgi:hypothetical protein